MNALKRTFGFIHSHPLAKNHLLTAYFRFFNWQIKCRIYPKLTPYLFLHGIYFFAKKGLSGITGNIYAGLHEFNDMGFLLHFLRPTDTFFDVGANVGSYTLLASGVCKSKSIAFEPIPATYQILTKNIALNNLEAFASAENKGVSSKNGVLTFTASNDTTNHVIAHSATDLEAISVPVVTLNDYISSQPMLMKIDVEGFETEVLNGADQILSNSILKAIIIELNGSGERYNYDEGLIHEKLINHSFLPYTYDPFNRKLTKLGTYDNFNTIYVRDIEFVNNRLEQAKSFTVFNEII